MSKKDDGGPAFPFAGEAGHSLNDSGMTLRDYFAAKAIVTAPHNLHDVDLNAEWAYRMADAMIAERNKP